MNCLRATAAEPRAASEIRFVDDFLPVVVHIRNLVPTVQELETNHGSHSVETIVSLWGTSIASDFGIEQSMGLM